MADKADPPQAEPEVNQLATAIAGEGGVPPFVEDASGGVSTPDSTSQAPPKDKEGGEPPKDGKPPEDSTGKPKEEPKTDAKPSETQEGLDKLFEGINLDDPKAVVAVLLRIPKVGSALQSWSDTAGAAQTAAALDHERPTIAAEARQRAEDQRWEEHFAGRSDEDIADEITKDKRAAAAYARYQARLESGPGDADPEAVVAASKVYAYTAQITMNTRLLAESDLPADVKERLKPENYVSQGPDGILVWGEDIFKALVEQAVEPRAQAKMEEDWEVFKQEHLAKLEGNRPPNVAGSNAGVLPDLMETDSGALLEGALAGGPDKKE